MLWQRPNPPLWIWAVATVGARLLEESTVQRIIELVAFGALFTWAYLEMTDGVNYFRRALGLAVLLGLSLNI